MVSVPGKINRPDFAGVERFWTELLQSRGLPTAFRWVFYEDYARLPSGFAFRPATETRGRPDCAFCVSASGSEQPPY